MESVATLREENDELRERIRQLTEQLAATTFAIPREYGLTPMETLLFRHLLTRTVITRRSAMMLFYSDRAGDEPDERTVDVYIHRLRRKLAAHAIDIENIYGQGWRLPAREAIVARFP